MPRRNRKCSAAVLFLVTGIFVCRASAQVPNAKFRTTRQEDIKVAMRDGVRLSTNVTRPDTPGKFPAILVRTPYNKFAEEKEFLALVPLGYVVVAQDCRGRVASEGEWMPFLHEAHDGYDTIDWVAAQAWSDGRVITAGGSYSAMDQWLAATQHNPHLTGMISEVSPSDFYFGVIYDGGAFNQAALQMWSYLTAGGTLRAPEKAPVPWEKVFRQLPLENGLKLLHTDVNFFNDWIAHPTDDAYWRQIRFDDEFNTINVPVLHITGWYDMFQEGTIEDFRQMHDHAPTSVRGKQLLVVGPWGHNQFARKVGDVDFGDKAEPHLEPLIVSWLDHVLNERQDGYFAAPVRIFTMGEDEWHTFTTWPVPGAKPTKYYLHSEGKANGASEAGVLSTNPPAQEPPDRYVYDPNDPVPTRGGGNCCWPDLVPFGPKDQRDIENRADILVYTTPPLANDVRVTGSLQAKLWVASSARDTDFTVKVVDVYPDGLAINIADGVLRARYRNSFRKPQLLVPGRTYELSVDLGNTSNLFKAGHRIRVEVSSSNFPHVSRNTNTGTQPEIDSNTKVARQTIFHDKSRASYVVMSVLP